jgi:hypothetical protein
MNPTKTDWNSGASQIASCQNSTVIFFFSANKFSTKNDQSVGSQ